MFVFDDVHFFFAATHAIIGIGDMEDTRKLGYKTDQAQRRKSINAIQNAIKALYKEITTTAMRTMQVQMLMNKQSIAMRATQCTRVTATSICP